MSGEIVSKGGTSKGFCVLVHGGAGNVAEDRRAMHAEGCRLAARAAALVLARGGSALDAVERAVRVLEDDPLFNAGTGACMNDRGEIEHDASIMEGAELRAGAVCALRTFSTPIAIARAALEDGRHVLYAAHGARQFALDHGFQEVAEATLVTASARAAWEAARAGGLTYGWAGSTVGAVARDRAGHVASATSTGGTMNKRAGRVGDTPILGAGTYADDRAGAVSTTGDGEAMLRIGGARLVSIEMAGGAPAEAAARAGVEMLSGRVRATGGIIAIDREGRWGWSRSTATMSWARVDEDGEEAGV